MTLLWKGISGYGSYEVSEIGNIRRSYACPRRRGRGGSILSLGALLKGFIGPRGYRIYILYSDEGKRTQIGAHVAVALAFHGPKPSKKHWALHWDDNKNNNHYKNIRWGTPVDNRADARRNGTLCIGSKHGRAIVTEEIVRKIRKDYAVGTSTLRDIGNNYGINKVTVHNIVTHHTWKHVT